MQPTRVLAVVVVVGWLATFGGIATGTVLIDETEPNDAPGNATEVTPGETVRGELDSPTDLDYYVLEGETGRNVTVNFTSQVSNDSVVGLFDSEGDFRGAHYYRSGESRGFEQGIGGNGTVYLVVRNVDNNATGSYTLAVDTAPDTRGNGESSGDGGTGGFGPGFGVVGAAVAVLLAVSYLVRRS